MDTNKNSLIDIEKMRMEMIHLAHLFGFTSPTVIQCSQKLDLLLNAYQKTLIH
jgi:hypothetical protein